MKVYLLKTKDNLWVSHWKNTLSPTRENAFVTLNLGLAEHQKFVFEKKWSAEKLEIEALDLK